MKRTFSVIVVLFILGTSAGLFSSCGDSDTPTPETDAREKFLGKWTVDESCVRLNYEVEITADSTTDTKVWLDNFAFSGPDSTPAYGLVNGDQIDLPEQTIGDNWTINGIGTLQPTGKIKWNYHIEIGATASNCEADYFR